MRGPVEVNITDRDAKAFKRLDHFLIAKLEGVGRRRIKEAFQAGGVAIQGGLPPKLHKMPPVGSAVTVSLPPPREFSLRPQNIPLSILYEDECLIVLNKPQGMVVHPACGNREGTLANALLYHCKGLGGVGEAYRPGIVHRLDKGTSGVMVSAKDEKAHRALTALFSCPPYPKGV